MNIFFESIILIVTGILVLKLTGSKSVSQMTRAEIIIVASIGRIIVEPVLSSKVGSSILAACIFSGVLLIIHYLEMKSRKMEQFLNGNSIIIIQSGKILQNNLRRAKMTEQQLLMYLREQGIHDIKILQQATVEPNGRVGYQLTAGAQPVTCEMLEKILHQYNLKKNS
ncbi:MULTISPECIES: DUF421 domain-containing protein [Bacillus]|uniref:DUF421 domain-containing protein n=1 Tax=Bacillus pseudomycoides TaxID=64104 RepID=A0A1Y3MP84_9BACI|nr:MULTISPECIES: YetF domain-containing protein [Bacillus cereus group]EOQ08393.1 hypothetical protein KOY_02606 [Bacillus cereus VDM021]OOG92856.1 hypothetical protein BTH41_04878 [Bacillus mycoides]MDF2085474.1 DUF421 domain-containing protein [Bacillus pseudomycoides]OUM50220.1 DUF421 domain-containing protein [Bacillus pseudomycoides]PEK70159.1 DUF421 domain-containing protein [Bacillus pseudomycoides]